MRRNWQTALGIVWMAALLAGWASPSGAKSDPASSGGAPPDQQANGLQEVQASPKPENHVDDAQAAYRAGDYATALRILRELAEQGEPAAQVMLGLMYAEGRGVAKDETEAVKWYRKAADQGLADGQSHLGFMYEQGRGVAKDDVEAVKWYRKAAEQGLAMAQNLLGIMYYRGRGIAKDEAEAVAWYRKAAEQGYAAAQVNLGLAYHLGRVVPQDDVEAVKWFGLAADQGDAMAQHHLGKMLDPLRKTAIAERAFGRWDAAVEHFRQAERLDPRSVSDPRALGDALLRLRCYPEAREALDRGLRKLAGRESQSGSEGIEWKIALARSPANLDMIEGTAMTFLGEGDLAGAQAVLKAAAKEVEPTVLVAYVASYADLVWVLDEEQWELLLRLMPSAFHNDWSTWALCLVQTYALKSDATNVRTYAEEVRKAVEEQLHAAPQDATRHVILGLALAYLGRKEEAIREGECGVSLVPIAKDAVVGPYYQHQLVRIYTLVGEPEKALDQLEPLLKIPYYLSPGWLKIDPNFDPLRKNPRFKKLVDAK